jgi:stage II sporulation protein D
VIAINQVGLEDYVSSVVGSEMGHRFPMEALKAQAVVSRTYALYHRSRRSSSLLT